MSTSSVRISFTFRKSILLIVLVVSCLVRQKVVDSQNVFADSGPVDCQTIGQLVDLCHDTDHAKTVCRRFCGLCDYADASWSFWLQWSNCDVSCGSGSQTRIRTCTSPPTSNGEKDCLGVSKQTQDCSMQHCPVHGSWSTWSPWGSCSVTCGVGLQRRERTCSNPYPVLGGDHCFGDSTEYEVCSCFGCTDGGWSVWGSWTSCSITCGDGIQTRSRSCDNPLPSLNGKYCPGDPYQVQSCNLKTCQGPKSSFTAETAVLLPNGMLKYSNVYLNEGYNFDANTGSFTCRYPGLYLFIANLVEGGVTDNNVDCYIRRGTVRYVSARQQNPRDNNGVFTHNGYGAATAAEIFHLAFGDTVDVFCSGGSSYLLSSFTGTLLAADV